MKIFKKNEIKFLFRKNFNYSNKGIIFKSMTEKIKNQQQSSQNSKLKISISHEDKFPTIEENISNLLNELDSTTKKNTEEELKQFIEQKNEVLFINNNLNLLQNLKLSDLIVINKTYIAKCLAINNKVSTFVLFDKIK